MSKVVLRAALAAALLLASPVLATAEVIKIGLSGPMSGAGASWGLLAEWAAKQAADEINKEGGVKVDGKTYTFEAIAYDNKYTASEGAKVGRGANQQGRRALRGLRPRHGAGASPAGTVGARRRSPLHHGGRQEHQGAKVPLYFHTAQLAVRAVSRTLWRGDEQHPNAKSVVIVEPNDATGQEAGESPRPNGPSSASRSWTSTSMSAALRSLPPWSPALFR